MEADSRRREMVETQLVRRAISDPRVLEAMRRMPRERFVPESLQDEAYDDRALAISAEQTISQPYMVAAMLQALKLAGSEKILEVGAGSGYNAALLGRLAREVHSIEIVPTLAESARERLAALGIKNVSIHTGDGSAGLLEEAPFDRIVVTAAAPAIPPPLVAQLTPEGLLLVPVTCEPGHEVLTAVCREGNSWRERPLGNCAFIPLVGKYGKPGDESPPSGPPS